MRSIFRMPSDELGRCRVAAPADTLKKEERMKKSRKMMAVMLLLTLSLTACKSQNTAGTAQSESTNAENTTAENTTVESTAAESTAKETTAKTGLFVPGTYEASAQGFGGEVKVTVTVTEDAITEVVVKGDGETPSLGGVAVERLGKDMVAAQAPEVDIIASASAVDYVDSLDK